MKRKIRRASYRDLESWDRLHGFDVGALFEERPDLFRALIARPESFTETALGKKYAAAVGAAAAAARKKQVYRSAFAPPFDARTAKEEQSIGLLPHLRKR